MGEFVLALSVLEGLCDKRFSYDEVDALLKRRLDAFGRFYMHTVSLSPLHQYQGMVGLIV